MGLFQAANSAFQSSANFLSRGFEAALNTGGLMSRLAIGIPLPNNVTPLIIPLAGTVTDPDPGWSAAELNQFTPMSFYLNIHRNLNPLSYGVAAAAGVTNIRGIQNVTQGGGRSVEQLQDSGKISYIPTGLSGLQQAALRQVFVPPLTLLVNPREIRFNYPKDFEQYQAKGGVVTEYLGNNLADITATGTSTGLYTKEAGITRMKRTQSLGFQNLMSLYLIYRNNGCDYLQYAKNTISVVGAVTIFYDGVFYIGSFRNFSLGEDASNPFRLRYNFQFTVRSRLRSYAADAANIPFPLLTNLTATLGTV